MPTQFSVKPIQPISKGEMKRLRKTGFIPVSIQHKGQGTLHYQLETKPLDDFIRAHGEAAMLELTVEGGASHQALVHDVQRDGLTRKLLQVTFQSIQRGDVVKVHVPLMFHGEPASVRLGSAVMQHSIEQVEIHCQPGDLPDHITIDVSNMTATDTLRVSDLPHSDKYKIVTSPDTVLVSLTSLHTEGEAPAPTVVDETTSHTDGFAVSPAMPHETTEPAAE